MQWLTLVPEDAGVQPLRTARPPGTTTGPLDAVAGCPSAHRVPIGDKQAKHVAAPHRERRRGERRQSARRGQHLTGAFDTRSKHDRRDCQDRRRAAGATAPALTGAGIDVYA